MRVMNPSESPIQLHAVQKIMQIILVRESTTVSRSLDVLVSRTSAGNICASFSCQSVMDDCTWKELETANSPSIVITNKQVLLDTLLQPDVFNDGLCIRLTQGHLLLYKNTLGVSPTIFARKLIRRLLTC